MDTTNQNFVSFNKDRRIEFNRFGDLEDDEMTGRVQAFNADNFS